MLQFSNLTIGAAVANRREETFSSAKPMVYGDNFKNVASPKSQMSRENLKRNENEH